MQQYVRYYGNRWGSYLHNGLSKQLVKLSVVAEFSEILSIDVNIIIIIY